MIRVQAAGREFNAELFVFDKDGLMFESAQFWRELASARINALNDDTSPEMMRYWKKCMGIQTNDNGKVTNVDPLGVLAIAPPEYEVIITAGMYAAFHSMHWTSAYALTQKLFKKADDMVSLERSLTPRKGFPDILRRLRKAGVPYGIATSDTYERAIYSLNLFDNADDVSFIITPCDVEQGKPDPEMLKYISARTGIAMERIVMIGDSVVDVEMARRTGAIGIGVPEREDMKQRMLPYADVIAEDLDQIKLIE